MYPPIENPKHTISKTKDTIKHIIFNLFFLLFFIHFIVNISAGTVNTYENITCLNKKTIDNKFSTKEEIGIIFILSFVIRTKFAIFIVAINNIIPIVPSIRL